jgi:hypothetical protein
MLHFVQEWHQGQTNRDDDAVIINTIYSHAIIQTHQNDMSKKMDYDPFGEGFLQRFRADLASKIHVGNIFHSNGNHWVAIVMDIKSATLFYGDPA